MACIHGAAILQQCSGCRRTRNKPNIGAKTLKCCIAAKTITRSRSGEPAYVYTVERTTTADNGYRVSNMVGVKVRDLDKLGGVLDQLVGGGANQMHGLTFDVSKAEIAPWIVVPGAMSALRTGC